MLQRKNDVSRAGGRGQRGDQRGDNGPVRSAATDAVTTMTAVIAILRTSPYQKVGSGDIQERFSFTSTGGPLLMVW